MVPLAGLSIILGIWTFTLPKQLVLSVLLLFMGVSLLSILLLIILVRGKHFKAVKSLQRVENERLQNTPLTENQIKATQLFDLGNAFYYKGRWSLNSIEAFMGAVSLNPNYADAWYNLSIALRSLGRVAEADQAMRRYEDITRRDDGSLDALNLKEDTQQEKITKTTENLFSSSILTKTPPIHTNSINGPTIPHQTIHLPQDVFFVETSPSNSYIACSLNGNIQIWDFLNFRCVHIINPPGQSGIEEPQIPHFSPDGRYLAIEWTYRITIYDTHSWELVFEPVLAKAETDFVEGNCITFTHDGRFIAFHMNHIIIWQVGTWKKIADIEHPLDEFAFSGLSVSHNGKYLAFSSQKNKSHSQNTSIFNIDDGTIVVSFPSLFCFYINDYLVEYDNCTHATLLRDPNTFEIVREFKGVHVQIVSPDGTHMLCDAREKGDLYEVLIFEIPNGVIKGQILMRNPMDWYSFSGDNHLLTGANGEAKVPLWEINRLHHKVELSDC